MFVNQEGKKEICSAGSDKIDELSFFGNAAERNATATTTTTQFVTAAANVSGKNTQQQEQHADGDHRLQQNNK